MIKKCLTSFFLMTLYLNAHALETERLITFAPPIINPHNFSFEFGFMTQKELESFDYHYNTFGKVFLAEEYDTYQEDLRSAALGAKVGVLLPLTPWFPLFLELGFGYAKTVLHHRPWFGRKSQSRQSDDMALTEGGLLLSFKNGILLRGTWQFNNIDYFKEELLFSVGYSY